MERDSFIANYTAWRSEQGLPIEPEVWNLIIYSFLRLVPDSVSLWNEI